MLAAGVGQGQAPRARPGRVEEALAALELTLELGAGTVNDDELTQRNNVARRHVSRRLARADRLPRRARREPEGVVNSRGWTPLRIADGVALDGVAFIRYPEAAAHLRELCGRGVCRCRRCNPTRRAPRQPRTPRRPRTRAPCGPRLAGSERRTVAHELRDHPLLAARRRPARVQRSPIGLAVLVSVHEEQTLAALPLV